MVKVMLSDPGFIDSKYIDLFNLLPKDINQLQDQDIKSKEIQKLHDIIISEESNNALITTISIDDFERVLSISQEIKPENLENFLTKDFFYKLLYFSRPLKKDPIIKYKMHCPYCLYIRPERSHHCKKCRKCVLKMDHHCDILNSCIGFSNYNLYIVFLFYATCISLFLACTWIDAIQHYFVNYGWENTNCKIITISSIIVIMILISVVDLFIIHLSFISKGVTTIENQGNLVENLSSEDNKKSCWQNMKEVMGDNPCNWFLPKSI